MSNITMDKYAEWIVWHPWSVIAAALVIIASISIGLGLLVFRSDDRLFFSQENPELQALETFELKYGREDSLVFIVSVKNGDLFTPQRLAAINELTDRAWRMTHAKRVDSVTNFQRVSARGDDITIDHLARSGDPLTMEKTRELRNAALREPMLLGRLLTTDAKVGLVAVQFRLNDEMQGDIAGMLMQEARAIATGFIRRHPDIDLGISGSLALDSAFGEASAKDGRFLGPLMLVLIFTLIGVIFQSLWIVLASLLTIAAAITCAMGSAGFLQLPLSSPSLAAPFIILTLATADCIHQVAAMYRAFHRHPQDKRKLAVSRGLSDTFRPVTITSLTTAIGFFSLIFSESPPFRHLGIIAGSGVIYAWALTITLFPALLVLLPWRCTRTTLLLADNGWRRLHRLISKYPTRIAASILVMGLCIGGFAFNNRLDDSYVAYFDESFSFRIDTDYLNRHLGGFYTLEYSLAAGAPGAIAEPTYIDQVDSFANWLRSQPEVAHVTTLSDIMRTMERSMNGGGDDAYRLPERRDQAAQYLWLYEMGLPVGLDLRETVTANKSESRMTVSLRELSTEQVLDLVRRATEWVAENAPILKNSASATGTTVLFSHIGRRNIEQMLTGTMVALLLISACLFIIFRSFVLGLIAIVSNILPSLAALGGWALCVGEVGMAVATIVAVTLGIVVDDTTHFIDAVQRAKREDRVDAKEAVLTAMLRAGPGIVTTTVVLASGFFCLAFSGFQINAWMGLMTGIVISVAFIFDILFLPTILIKARI